MKNTIILLSVFLSIICNTAFGIDTLSLQTYMGMVSKNHPLIQKADLFDRASEAYLLKAKGVLDPKIESDLDRKSFDNIEYFTVWQTEAKIPTRFPVDFSVGYENNEGQFLNAENNVPSNGLLYGTINVSLLRGLIFDQQRYNILNADLNALMGQVEGEIIRREVQTQAISAYLDWAATAEKNKVASDFLETVQIRHQNIIQLFVNGDKPAIDTIESRVSLNTAQKLLLESRQELLKSEQKVALFLWDSSGKPLTIRESVLPQSLNFTVNYIEENSILNNPRFSVDPLIRKMDNKITQYALDNKLVRENLKPTLNLKYNTIINFGKDEIDPSFTLNDYKYGVTASLPILNRKTKGDIMLNEVKIEQTQFERSQYEQKLFNEYNMLRTNQALQNQTLEVAQQKFKNSQTLYEAEIIKFDLGESSVFMLNSRERKLLESKLELLKSYTKLGQTATSFYFLKLGQI